MQRHPALPLALLGLLIVLGTAYVSSRMADLRDAVMGLRESLVEPNTTTVILKNEEGMKTGKLSKILNGTEITLDYDWDCTVEDWRRILAEWKIICDNPPPKE